MIEDKLKQLEEEYAKVVKEVERLSQIGLKLAGAIEVLTGMKEEPETVKEKEDK